MTKKTYIRDDGIWLPLLSVWRKVSGTWQKDVVPWIRAGGTWQDCMEYGANIKLAFESSTHWTTFNSTTMDAYRELEISGRQPGNVLTIDFNYTYTLTSGSVIARIYSRIDGGIWTAQTGFMDSSESGTIRLYGIDDEDTIDIRLYLWNGVSPIANLQVEVDSGFLTTGEGNVSVSSPTSWEVGFLES